MKITYELVKSLGPCYDPVELGVALDYSATIPDFIREYRHKVKSKSDIVWVLCHNVFMIDKELRLFAIWCARQVQHLMTDQRSINALDVSEKYLNGEATIEQLNVAYAAARDAARDAADHAAATYVDARYAVASLFAYAAARSVAYAACAACAAADADVDAAYVAYVRSAALDDDARGARDVQIDKLLEMFEQKEAA